MHNVYITLVMIKRVHARLIFNLFQVPMILNVRFTNTGESVLTKEYAERLWKMTFDFKCHVWPSFPTSTSICDFCSVNYGTLLSHMYAVSQTLKVHYTLVYFWPIKKGTMWVGCDRLWRNIGYLTGLPEIILALSNVLVKTVPLLYCSVSYRHMQN